MAFVVNSRGHCERQKVLTYYFQKIMQIIKGISLSEEDLTKNSFSKYIFHVFFLHKQGKRREENRSTYDLTSESANYFMFLNIK